MPNIIGTLEITCAYCLKRAIVKKYDTRVSKFCSLKCSAKFYNHPSTCSIADCEKRAERKGLCQMHFWRLKHHGDVNHYRYRKDCSVANCDRPHSKNGLCALHALRMKRHGTTADPVRVNDPRRYKIIKRPNHPLAFKNGRVFVHRATLYDAIPQDVHNCHWCKRQVTWYKSHPGCEYALVVDHLDQNRQNNDLSNLVPSCNSCNSKRTRKPKFPSAQ